MKSIAAMMIAFGGGIVALSAEPEFEPIAVDGLPLVGGGHEGHETVLGSTHSPRRKDDVATRVNRTAA